MPSKVFDKKDEIMYNGHLPYIFIEWSIDINQDEFQIEIFQTYSSGEYFI